MIDYLHSTAVKKFVRDNSVVFSDRELAALICASQTELSQMHQALADVAEKSNDAVLREAITACIKEDNELLAKMQDTASPAAYALHYVEAETPDFSYTEGFYTTFEKACGAAKLHIKAVADEEAAFAAKRKADCSGAKEDIRHYVIKHPVDAPEADIYRALFNQAGEVTEIRKNNTPCPWRSKLMNIKFTHPWHPFRRGDVVRPTGQEKIAIVAGNGDTGPEADTCPARHLSLQIEMLGRDGFFCSFAKPSFLEYADLDRLNDNTKKIFSIASECLRGNTLKGSFDSMTMIVNDYKKLWELWHFSHLLEIKDGDSND